jgi:hypothetical protein
MTSSATRRLPAKPEAQPVQEFLASLEDVARHATRVEKLSRQRLLDQLSAVRTPRKEKAALLLQHIDSLTRRFEHIRRTLQEEVQDEELDQLGVAARRKGEETFRKMVREGVLLEPAAVAARLGWTRQALSKALAARRVYFVEMDGVRYYPAFFADSRYERRHVEALSKALGELPGSTKLHFMTTPKAPLSGLSPLQALAQGQFAAAKVAAEGFAQR